MPATSMAQLNAKAGNSTLGIPQKVGADFVAATGSPSGLPQRKTSRGKRGSGKSGQAGDPASHLANLTKAHGSGDHVQARKHAFAFVRALDAKHGLPAKAAPMMPAKPARPIAPATAGLASETPALQAPKSNPSRLLAALKASRKSTASSTL